MKCPMMGPKLAQIGQQRGYASVAGNREVEEIHKVSRSENSIDVVCADIPVKERRL